MDEKSVGGGRSGVWDEMGLFVIFIRSNNVVINKTTQYKQ